MRIVTATILVSTALAVAAPAARAQFVEPDVTVLHTLSGEVPGELFGWAISELRDIDDDGVTDLIVGAPFASDGTTFAGRTDVYSGRTGQRIHRLTGLPNEQHGWSMADAGDVDRDGVPDILVGAPAAGAGRVYIVSGATGGTIAFVDGEQAGDFFGFAVSSLGDIDDDRVPDFVVGAGRASVVAPFMGRVYVYSGKQRTLLRTIDGTNAGDLFGTGVDGTGDLDGDGKGDFVVGARQAGPTRQGQATAYSSATFEPILPIFQPGPTGVDLGWFFVAGLRDVDGDGTADLYVGDPSDSTNSGRAYVYSGRTGATLYDFPGAAGEGAACGRGAGDVDGDRREDIIVGAYLSSQGAPVAGRATVYSGCTGAPLRTMTNARAGDTVGYDTVGLGDVNGDREGDFALAGASGDRVYVVAGARTCIADFDRDGDVDRRDHAGFLVALLTGNPRADTNCDGARDVHDYLDYLRAVLLGCG